MNSFLFYLFTLSFSAFAEPKHVFLIGWDGLERNTLEKLEKQGDLPNFSRVIKEGGYVQTLINEGKTQTKGGWAQILSGYNTSFTRVRSNKNYRPLAQGLSVFERLEDKYAEQGGIVTLFFAGKGENLGARGPHRICINCRRRFTESYQLTGWWWEFMQLPLRGGDEPYYDDRLGEPYFYTKQRIDVFDNYLGPSAVVSKTAFTHIKKHLPSRMFAFIHLREPDEPGHIYGIQSAEYIDAIKANDRLLGQLIQILEKAGVYQDSVIMLTTDHSMDTDEFEDVEQRGRHRNAPDTFIAVNRPVLPNHQGDRRDVTPTILDLFGFQLEDIYPPLHGSSLLAKPQSQ